jgi:succinate dehydrogenase/fumarate reductase flavoprotein subunit
MAQMTVAAALAEESDDDWRLHLADTLEAGRGLCDETLAAILCEEAPLRIREMGEWQVGWARRDDGRIAQVTAPGHSRPRCCYVDFLNTGPAVAATLRRQISRADAIRRVSNLTVTDLVTVDGAVVGAVALDAASGAPVTIAAKATIIATGGLTRIYRRNSASANMGGDGYALALMAGAPLVDMEFVQFFPIGHLAPRLVGMDPIMWDPFRYKLGGRLLDGAGREFLARNGIDLARAPVEVSPIAHYHMGGIVVDERMASAVPGLYAAGEAVGGANGANRLSGNAIPEALVFGERAGRFAAAAKPAAAWRDGAAREAVDRIRDVADGRAGAIAAAALLDELRALMGDDVGPLRGVAGLERALARLGEMRAALGEVAIAPGRECNASLADWFELRASLIAAEAVARAALARRESRGAHQREDFPASGPEFARSRLVAMDAARGVAAGLAR